MLVVCNLLMAAAAMLRLRRLAVTIFVCRCSSGCTCEPRRDVDALHALRQSTIYLVRLLVSQSEECEISVTVSGRTRSSGHKFKVGGCLSAACAL